MEIFSRLLLGLGDALDLRTARHRVHAENLANAETPGYRSRILSFEDQLGAVLRGERTEVGAPEPVVDRAAEVKPNGNSVDVDREMARMSSNTVETVAITRIVSRKYGGLKSLLTELGRR